MYLFFLFCFVFISICLIFLILLQPGKGFNNTAHVNSKSHIKFFGSISENRFITNIIRFFSFLFLLTSIILCNINSRKMEPDFFWEKDKKNTIRNESITDKKWLNDDIPH